MIHQTNIWQHFKEMTMLNVWQQVYDPLANIWLSSLIALIPIIFFFLALAVFRLKGSIAATLTVMIALAIALFFYQMPAAMALLRSFTVFFTAYGRLHGLF
jgi:L-lactate permease